MIIKKFGGASLGSAERIRNAANIVINDPQNMKVVVLSAISGTTNSLSEICTYLSGGNIEGAVDVICRMEKNYDSLISELLSQDFALRARSFISDIFSMVRSQAKVAFTPDVEKTILAQGEIISCQLFSLLLESLGVEHTVLNALDFMRLALNREPDTLYIRNEFQKSLENAHGICLVQGYLCRNAFGNIDNLGRGGSDYSASLLGSAIQAEIIEIWTDTTVMQGVDHISFDEAAELAYFGAKILHPSSLQPARAAGIPVRLLNVLEPLSAGTLINDAPDLSRRIRAVASKDNITAIRIKSSKMLLAHGFLRRIFEIFESYRTSIDMICTSEVSVSLTIDDTTHISEILHDLKQYGTVTVDHDMSVICVVGDIAGLEADVLNALKNIPLRMASWGGSEWNISLLVSREDRDKALEALGKLM